MNTNTRVQQNKLFFVQKGAQPSQMFSFWKTRDTKPEPISMRVMRLAYGEYKLGDYLLNTERYPRHLPAFAPTAIYTPNV
jgi:hypothetical protein